MGVSVGVGDGLGMGVGDGIGVAVGGGDVGVGVGAAPPHAPMDNDNATNNPSTIPFFALILQLLRVFFLGCDYAKKHPLKERPGSSPSPRRSGEPPPTSPAVPSR
ncbi:MAG TPA: hypothetical protein ENK56_08455 [Chloroflexi bacterium]|nr:hypothetical protein [Chloroflexota bacterium]